MEEIRFRVQLHLATLDLLEGGMMHNASEVGSYTQDALSEIATRHPSIGQVRGIGLMIGIEFVSDPVTKRLLQN